MTKQRAIIFAAVALTASAATIALEQTADSDKAAHNEYMHHQDEHKATGKHDRHHKDHHPKD